MAYEIIVGRDESDKIKFGNEGLIYIGKTYVSMGQTTSLTNKVLMDVARSHVVLIAGKRGCLAGNTLVFTDKGYKPIKEFDQKNDRVLSFDKETKNFEWENAELLNYPIKNEKLLKIEFADGRSIILTKEHPLLMNYGKYLFWRMANQLKVNDKIILPTELPKVNNSKESLRMARILGFVLSDGTISKRKGRWKDGRGYWYNGTKSRLRIFNDCPEVLERAKKDLEEEFKLHVKRYKRNDCNCDVIQALHAPIIDKLNKLGIPLGNKAGVIRIPKIVWQSSNEFKANFIAALFSCDGYTPKTGRYLDYASKSREFLQDLQLLLGHFDIESVIREKNAKCNGKVYENYRLFITDNQSVKNFKKIGFFSNFKQERLEKHISTSFRKSKTMYFSDKLVCRKIKKIEEIYGINEVYDLSVNKNHSFIANGIISHNSGKSYTLGVLAEEMAGLPESVGQNIAVLIFDTMGIFWTMAYKNEKEDELLKEWQLESKKLPIRVFVPHGFAEEYASKGIPVTKGFAMKVSELEADDWTLTFGLNFLDPVSVLIQQVVYDLHEEKKAEGKDFDIEDIIFKLNQNQEAEKDTKNAAIGLFRSAKTWGLFVDKTKPSTEVKELIEGGKTSILDLSPYSATATFNVRALVIGLISKKIFNERMEARKFEEIESVKHGLEYLKYKEKREMPLVWLFIDELHEFLPETGKTSATDSLIQILREGRQPGISLAAATQQPAKLHTDVWTQSDIVISHRVTAKPDVQALSTIMQSYLLESISGYMNNLPHLKGSAIILDDNSERIYPMRMRARFTWHGGETPSAIKVKKRI